MLSGMGKGGPRDAEPLHLLFVSSNPPVQSVIFKSSQLTSPATIVFVISDLYLLYRLLPHEKFQNKIV